MPGGQRGPLFSLLLPLLPVPNLSDFNLSCRRVVFHSGVRWILCVHVCVSPCVGEGMLGPHVLGENKGSEELTLEN